MPTTRWGAWPKPGLKLARIDIDPAEIPRLPVDIGIVADSADALRALRTRWRPGATQPAPTRLRVPRSDMAEEILTVQPQMSYVQAIREVLPEDGILCDEMTQVGYVSWFGFPFHAPRSLITSGFSGTLGAGFPTALGRQGGDARPGGGVAKRRRRVPVWWRRPCNGRAVSASTWSRLCSTTRPTATSCAISTGCIEGRDSGSALRNPDFQAFAKSFGVPAWRVTDADGLRGALAQAIKTPSPTFIEVMTDIAKEVAPWKFIAPARG